MQSVEKHPTCIHHTAQNLTKVKVSNAPFLWHSHAERARQVSPNLIFSSPTILSQSPTLRNCRLITEFVKRNLQRI